MVNKKVIIKSEEEVKLMAEGGKKLRSVKRRLMEAVGEGVKASEIDQLAERLILEEGGKPSFKMVPRYHWATCVNVNEGIVHGIPKVKTVFAKGDVVSVDVGMFYKGFHTDTSITVGIEVDDKLEKFLEVGRNALDLAVKEAMVGNRVFDISKAIEKTVTSAHFSPIKALVGHGVGRDLHEEPQIPGFTDGVSRNNSLVLLEGMVLAIEVMYSQGSGEVSLEADGWTIRSSDGTITALFEDTVAVSLNGPKVLT